VDSFVDATVTFVARIGSPAKRAGAFATTALASQSRRLDLNGCRRRVGIAPTSRNQFI
jgi:hypothetical protein